jgi:hypothetical protein
VIHKQMRRQNESERRAGFRAYQCGGAITIAPNKKAAAENFRLSWEAPCPLRSVRRYTGPWEFWNHSDEGHPHVTDEETWIATIGTDEFDIALEGG